MLMATQNSVRFAHNVGVAPATTTMRLGGPSLPPLPSVMQSVLPGRTAPNPVAVTQPRYFMPYASLEDLRSANAGFGIVNESDAWLTGRPYGLPGTATIQLMQRPGGYKSPNGTHYDARMFGDADATLQLILAQQQAQAAHLKRIAFWQAFAGGVTIAGVAAGIAIGLMRGR
jgi:hypothetical protein